MSDLETVLTAISGLHTKVDGVQSTVGDIKTDVAVMKQRMKQVEQDIPEQPCPSVIEVKEKLTSHVVKHRKKEKEKEQEQEEIKRTIFGGLWHVLLEILTAIVVVYLLIQFGMKGL